MNIIKGIFLLLTVLSMSMICYAGPKHGYSSAIKPPAAEFCLTYIFHPKCRGAGAKRDLQKLEPLLEDPRVPRDSYLQQYQNNKLWSDKEANRRLLDTYVSKLSPKINEESIDDYI